MLRTANLQALDSRSVTGFATSGQPAFIDRRFTGSIVQASVCMNTGAQFSPSSASLVRGSHFNEIGSDHTTTPAMACDDRVMSARGESLQEPHAV